MSSPGQERLERIGRLVELADGEGLAALCRIARYEPNAQLARIAALAAMRSVVSEKEVSERVAAIRKEVGDSQRVTAVWLRTTTKQLEQPERVIDRWLTLIDDEIALLVGDSSDTKASLVLKLIDFHLELCREHPRPEAIFANLKRRTDLYTGSGQSRDGLRYAMTWLWKNEQWQALELLEDHYDQAIRQDRLLVYLAAMARWKQGREELAEEFAERALQNEGRRRRDPRRDRRFDRRNGSTRLG